MSQIQNKLSNEEFITLVSERLRMPPHAVQALMEASRSPVHGIFVVFGDTDARVDQYKTLTHKSFVDGSTVLATIMMTLVQMKLKQIHLKNSTRQSLRAFDMMLDEARERYIEYLLH